MENLNNKDNKDKKNTIKPHEATKTAGNLINLGHVFVDISQGAFPALIPFLKSIFSMTYSQVGVMLLIQSLTSSICQPLFGFISDKSSKSWFISVGILLSAVAMGAIVWAPNYAVLIILISISGFGSAIFHPQAMKATNRISPAEKKGEKMGIFSLGGNFGYALGAFLMGLLLTLPGDFQNTKYIAIPGMIFFIVLMFFNKYLDMATHAGDKHAIKTSSGKIPYGFICVLVCFIFMRSTAYQAINTFTPLFHVNFMNENSMFTGNYVSIFSVAGVFGTYYGGILSDKIGRRRIICTSMFLTVPLMMLMPFARGIYAMIIAGLSGFVVVASYSSTFVMAQEVMKDNMGLAGGLTAGFAIGLGGVGATVLGNLADIITLPVLMRWFWILPLCAALMTWLFPKDK